MLQQTPWKSRASKAVPTLFGGMTSGSVRHETSVSADDNDRYADVSIVHDAHGIAVSVMFTDGEWYEGTYRNHSAETVKEAQEIIKPVVVAWVRDRYKTDTPRPRRDGQLALV